MSTYTPDADNTSEPNERRGLGYWAAEARALKRKLASVVSSVGTLNTGFSSLSTDLTARVVSVESYVGGETTGLVGQVSPFYRPAFIDLDNWLSCNGRILGPDASEIGTPHTNPQLYGDTYKELFKHIWTTLAASRVQWYASSPSGLGMTGDSPLSIAFWDIGSSTWTSRPIPDVGVVADWEAAWNDPNALYAVFLPDLRGRGVRGANPMNGVTVLPLALNPDDVLAAQPDYGRMPGTYQAASLLAGDNAGGTQATTLDNVDVVREGLGWDKVGAKVPTGEPYASVDSASDLDPTTRLRVLRVDAAVWPASAPTTNRPLTYDKFLGAARTDNLSLPMFIRYR